MKLRLRKEQDKQNLVLLIFFYIDINIDRDNYLYTCNIIILLKTTKIGFKRLLKTIRLKKK